MIVEVVAAPAKALKAGDWDACLAIAKQQVENGAQIIDVCMDEGMLDGVAAMTRFLLLATAELCGYRGERRYPL